MRIRRDRLSGVTPEEVQQVRPQLEAFAAQMPGGFAGADQRAKGESCRPMTQVDPVITLSLRSG
jgi:hypothetical protein